ncbi:hypothetical protein C162_21733 [Paenibacillus sp. FSL R7-269]|uniref:hypothetical protein n=1 Tax=Paenibacillus sp. FSL R7-269 TaxID=1226755 RepID=UPI0003E1F690|nr:hypothetical protein [Paenibacillus sp. FSL R7-269]ETT45201.1 hypothetical protein C162_21733 [Paenibacillus sp. FSL R7-269]
MNGNMLTPEELTMVRDLILLPYLDTMVSKSLKEVELSSNVLNRTYITAGRYIQKRIIQDAYQLRQQLKQRNIKVVEDIQEDFVTYNMIYFRGYQQRFGLTRDVMRTEISLRLTRYTAELAEALRA